MNKCIRKVEEHSELRSHQRHRAVGTFHNSVSQLDLMISAFSFTFLSRIKSTCLHQHEITLPFATTVAMVTLFFHLSLKK